MDYVFGEYSKEEEDESDENKSAEATQSLDTQRV
jgi:hypothetical protein